VTGSLLVVLAAGMGLIAALGTPPGHSADFNTSWLTAFEAALRSGAIYPRHLPDIWFGLGGLDFFFYGPLPFYLAAGPARWLCGADCTASQVFAIAGAMLWGLSAASFWAFARALVAPGAALVGAVVYALMPYHLGLDWFTRQASGEFAAYVFVPVIALGLHRCLKDGRGGIAFPLGVAGLVLCHLPTALLAGHVFAAVWAVWALRHPRAAPLRTVRIGLLGLLGLALAGVYWLPAIVLLGDVSPGALYDAAAMLTPDVWLLGPDAPLPGGIGFAALIGASLVASLAAVVLATVLSPGARWTMVQWMLVPVLLCVFLNTALSAPVWNNWIIDRVQFPFRLLVFADLAAGLAAGVLVQVLSRAGAARAARLSAMAGLGILGLGVMLQGPEIAKRLSLPAVEPRMIGAPEYLPPAFFATVAAEAGTRGVSLFSYAGVVAGIAATVGEPGGPIPVEIRPRHWEAEVTGPGRVVLGAPYWRHMQARTGSGVPLAAGPDPQGWITLDLPPDTDRVRVTLPRHWSETAGLGLSGLGLAGTCAVAWRGRRRAGTSGTGAPGHT
jgi:hypothetical protein